MRFPTTPSTWKPMSDSQSPSTPPPITRTDQLFPKLADDHVARIAAHGRRRDTTAGEVLVEAGEQHVPFFVVVSGQLDIVQREGSTEHLVVSPGPGQFT